MIRFNNLFHRVRSLPLWLNHNQVDSNINSKLLFPHKRWTCYLSTKVIYYLYSLLVILKILLKVFFWNQTFQRLPKTVTNIFTIMRYFPLTYFYVLCKYYQKGEYGVVLGYPIQYFQGNIPLIKYWIKFPLWIVSNLFEIITKLENTGKC